MKKIRLDAETLAVESFAACDEPRTLRGTVNANGPRTNVCNTAFTFCETNCDCTLGCPSIAPCTIQPL